MSCHLSSAPWAKGGWHGHLLIQWFKVTLIHSVWLKQFSAPLFYSWWHRARQMLTSFTMKGKKIQMDLFLFTNSPSPRKASLLFLTVFS